MSWQGANECHAKAQLKNMLKAKLNVIKYSNKTIASTWRLHDKQIVADAAFVLYDQNDSRFTVIWVELFFLLLLIPWLALVIACVHNSVATNTCWCFRCTAPTVYSSLEYICVLKTVIYNHWFFLYSIRFPLYLAIQIHLTFLFTIQRPTQQ